VNTDKVQPLSATATKPASTGSQTVKRTTESPAVEQALIRKTPAVSETRSMQEATAAAAAQIESYLRSNGRSLHFSVDTQSGMTVVSVKDAATGDVIRQIPSEEALRLAHALQTQGGGSSLLDVEA